MIAAKVASPNERIAMIAVAMGCQVTDYIIDSIDFEGGEIGRGANRAYFGVVANFTSNVRGDKMVESEFELGICAISIRVYTKWRVK
jgi:hypothetical protein